MRTAPRTPLFAKPGPLFAPTGPAAGRRVPLVAAAVALLVLGAAGCGTGGTSSASATSASSAPSSVPSASGATTAPAATLPGATGAAASGGNGGTASRATGTGTGAAAGDRCTVTDLRMRLGRGDPGAGNVYYPVRFTNTSAHACVLDGYPGVSLIRGDGSTIGHPADRLGSRAKAVRLAPGQTVEADLHTVNAGIASGGCWGKPTFLKVYPPGSTQAMTLATATPIVCGDAFDVGAVH